MPATSICDLCGTAQAYAPSAGVERMLCRECGNILYPPGLRSTTGTTQVEALRRPVVFDRDVFFIFRRRSTFGQKTYVCDEWRRAFCYAERHAQIERVILAMILGFVAAVGFTAVFIVVGLYFGGGKGESGEMILVWGALFGPLLGVATGLGARPKAHISLYENESKSLLFFEVVEERRFRIFPTYAVRDSSQNHIGRLQTNSLWNIVRGRWWIASEDESYVASLKEDSLLLALLRGLTPIILRLLLPGKSFTIRGVEGWRIIGRYQNGRLDMSGDPERSLDRRLAIGIAVLVRGSEGF